MCVIWVYIYVFIGGYVDVVVVDVFVVMNEWNELFVKSGFVIIKVDYVEVLFVILD